VVVALPSGAGVALATTAGGITALVGVAISAALLPPVANAGSYLTYAAIRSLQLGKVQQHLFMVGLYSFLLFMSNLLGIFVCAIIFLKIKKIRPGRRLHRESSWIDPEQIHHDFVGGSDPHKPITIDDDTGYLPPSSLLDGAEELDSVGNWGNDED